MVSSSFSGSSPASVAELVVPCPMNSQPRFFISSTALGKTSQTWEFRATVAFTPAWSSTSARRHKPTRVLPVFAPGVVVDVGHIIGGIGRDADAEGGIVVPDFHIGGEPDRQCVIAGPLEWLALGDEGVIVAFDRRIGFGGVCAYAGARGKPSAMMPAPAARLKLFARKARRLRSIFGTVMPSLHDPSGEGDEPITAVCRSPDGVHCDGRGIFVTVSCSIQTLVCHRLLAHRRRVIELPSYYGFTRLELLIPKSSSSMATYGGPARGLVSSSGTVRTPDLVAGT